MYAVYESWPTASSSRRTSAGYSVNPAKSITAHEASNRPAPTANASPAATTLRVAASQTRRGQRKNFVASVNPDARRHRETAVAEAPRNRRRQSEPEGHVAGLYRGNRRGQTSKIP